MDAVQALILGIVQGITEWLPVSSSGHLVIAQELLGLKANESLVFDLIVHLGTLLAVIGYFRRQLWKIVHAVFSRRDRRSEEQATLRILGFLLLVATVPIAVAGVLFTNSIEDVFDIRLVGVAMVINGLFLLVVSRYRSEGQKKTAKLGDAIIIGLFQAVAIIPGISRSGSTMGGGMLRGLERETAAVFAFLVSVPSLIGALSYGALTLERYDATIETSAIGLATAFAVGLVSIGGLLKAVKSRKLWIFGAYCVALGAAVIALTSL